MVEFVSFVQPNRAARVDAEMFTAELIRHLHSKVSCRRAHYSINKSRDLQHLSSFAVTAPRQVLTPQYEN